MGIGCCLPAAPRGGASCWRGRDLLLNSPTVTTWRRPIRRDCRQRRYPDIWPCSSSEAYPHALGVGDILITADTVVICGGRIFGKPDGREGAAAMLAELSGRRHTVVTGVALRAPGRMRSFSVSSDVWFRPLAEEEIAYYVDTFRPYDKAGSYGIQEWIGYVAIERIEGSFYNVMGLPMQALYAELGSFVDTL